MVDEIDPYAGLTEHEKRLLRRRHELLLPESLKRLPRSLLRAAFARRNDAVLAQPPEADTPALDNRFARFLCAAQPRNLHLLFSAEQRPAEPDPDETDLVLPPQDVQQAARLLSLLAERYQPVLSNASFAEIAVQAQRHPRVRFVVGGRAPQGADAEALRGRVTALGELGWSYFERLAAARTTQVPKWNAAHASAAFFIKLWGRADRIVVVDLSVAREQERTAWIARAESHASEQPELVACVVGAGGAADSSGRLWTERHFGAAEADRALLLEECDERVGPAG